MRKSNTKDAHAESAGGEITLFRLYIAGETPNSGCAIANVKDICRKYLRDRHQLEIVDFLKEPLRSLSDGVLVTPTLVKLSPQPVRTIVGDLSDPSIVLHELGLEEGAK